MHQAEPNHTKHSTRVRATEFPVPHLCRTCSTHPKLIGRCLDFDGPRKRSERNELWATLASHHSSCMPQCKLCTFAPQSRTSWRCLGNADLKHACYSWVKPSPTTARNPIPVSLKKIAAMGTITWRQTAKIYHISNHITGCPMLTV